MTEKRLISGLISGDKEILKSFYVLYFNSIRHLVINNSGSLDDAKDVFQESLLILFQKFRMKEFKITCSIKTYLYSVAKNLWFKELNRRKRQVNDFIDLEEYIYFTPDIDELFERNERYRLYRNIFEKLSIQCQKILMLFNEGRSVKEITMIMGFKNDQHTKNRRYRCKLSLVNRIMETYGYHELNFRTDKSD